MTNTIKIKSKSCTAELKAEKDRLFGNIMVTTLVAAGIILFVLKILSLIILFILPVFMFEKSVSGFISFLQHASEMAVILIAVKICLSLNNKRKTVIRYINDAAVETLIVCEESIYGTTVSCDINLTYDQISSMRFYHKDSDKKNYVPEFLKTLEIMDTSGKKYEFNTFDNASELKAVIDQQRCK